jgi:hypothetical protein
MEHIYILLVLCVHGGTMLQKELDQVDVTVERSKVQWGETFFTFALSIHPLLQLLLSGFLLFIGEVIFIHSKYL